MNVKIDRRYDPENKLESVKEENQNENTTPGNRERNDEMDKDSIDSDIMKDLEVYRKE
jgi:hypothetical protein